MRSWCIHYWFLNYRTWICYVNLTGDSEFLISVACSSSASSIYHDVFIGASFTQQPIKKCSIVLIHFFWPQYFLLFFLQLCCMQNHPSIQLVELRVSIMTSYGICRFVHSAWLFAVIGICHSTCNANNSNILQHTAHPFQNPSSGTAVMQSHIHIKRQLCNLTYLEDGYDLVHIFPRRFVSI